MSVKRPRIDPAISRQIDRARGRIPFEPYVNDTLAEGVAILSAKTDAEAVLALVKTDRFQFDFKRFEAAVDAARELHSQRMDEYARDEEMEE